MWIWLILLILCGVMWIADRLGMEKKMGEAMSKCSMEKAALEENYRKEISRLLEINAQLKADGAIYRKISVQEVYKPIEKINVEVRIPYEIEIDKFIENYPSLVTQELWKMMKDRAIIEIRDDYYYRNKIARLSWFVNKDGEKMDDESFF